jgi:hypothetical protein
MIYLPRRKWQCSASACHAQLRARLALESLDITQTKQVRKETITHDKRTSLCTVRDGKSNEVLIFYIAIIGQKEEDEKEAYMNSRPAHYGRIIPWCSLLPPNVSSQSQIRNHNCLVV